MPGHPYLGPRRLRNSEKEGHREAVPASLADEGSSDENTSSDDEQITTRWRRPIKSGMNRTGATMVVKRITWPYDVHNNTARMPVAYEDLTVSSFVQ